MRPAPPLPQPLSLNGDWHVTTAAGDTFVASQPGVIGNPAQPSGALRLVREVALPDGDWTDATLLLKGAKYRPRVRVAGRDLGQHAGGLAPIRCAIPAGLVRPGTTVALEIDLASMTDVPPDDASMLPKADRWRANVSSGLWDDVELHFDRGARFEFVRPRTRFKERQLELHLRVNSNLPAALLVAASLRDLVSGAQLTEKLQPLNGRDLILELDLPPGVAAWSPASPQCYELQVELLCAANEVLARDVRTYGFRDFAVDGKSFRLNGEPFQARGGSICWHRFCRDAEGRTFAFDRDWFESEIVARYKAHGANWFRPHLGLPPEWLLDLCDRHGLCVQVEWPPFHGLPCSRESLVAQLTDWIDHAERHPSCVLFHPWNETYDQHELDKGAEVIATVSATFPHLVWAHRDVLHAHRYWWSLFENLKLPFDSRDVFPQPIVVDEFGGNYLDGAGNAGGYPELPSAFLRFLGPGHTAAQRLQLQCDASARIAEYWRRLGAAGIAQFCSLSSWEDGNHHFLGGLAERRPKPVWAAMTAAWAPVSVSLDLWDRNFAAGAPAQFRVWLFNDTSLRRSLRSELRLINVHNQCVASQSITAELDPHDRSMQCIEITLPLTSGTLTVQCELLDPPFVTQRVISSWKIFLHREPALAAPPLFPPIDVIPGDAELVTFCAFLGARTMPGAPLVLAGHAFWQRLAADDASARETLATWLRTGRDVLLLDAGPSGYGMETVSDQPKPISSAERRVPLALGLTAVFRELAEGESCFHATPEGASLWTDLIPEHTWLWNGMRGGAAVSCWDMHFEGLHSDAFLQQWQERGASPEDIRIGRCFAYELAGFYAFSPEKNAAVEKHLRQRVEFLFADAPALHSRVNPKAPILCTDLHAEWQKCGGQARRISALACAGKNLRRTPVVFIEFGEGHGRLVVSQLITAGRLAAGAGHPDYPEANLHYALRVDPAARIFVRNLLTLTARSG